MEKNRRISIESIDEEIQKKYKEFVLARWYECITKRLQVRIVINFDSGKVTSIQDQAIIAGSSVLDMYSQKVID